MSVPLAAPPSELIGDLLAVGLKQTDIGTFCGLSQAQISRVMRGIHVPGYRVVDCLRILHAKHAAEIAAVRQSRAISA